MTKDCRICRSSISPFMSFGRMPIANGFVTESQFKYEYFFELAPAFCSSCGAFQIMDQPAAEKMFHEDYAFFTRTSRRMVAHFAAYAGWVKQTQLRGSDPFVVEIGSNDGAMLENFAKEGMRHLGVEPSANTAEVARKHDVASMTAFFGLKTARRIRAERGAADAIIAANVICHIPDVNDVAAGVDHLLKADGVFVFEEPYLADMIEKTSYDQIYDEHVFIFSVRSVAAWFGRFGFDVVDAVPQETHGGSMRYVVARRGARPRSEAVDRALAHEQGLKLDQPATYKKFAAACERSREGLVATIRKARAAGKRVVGYAATSKSTTVINYCGLNSSDIEFISDTTPLKHGKYSPGAHIPVRPHMDFAARYPDYAVLFAWNHQAEIFANEKDYVARDGKWIVFVPAVAVVGR